MIDEASLEWHRIKEEFKKKENEMIAKKIEEHKKDHHPIHTQ